MKSGFASGLITFAVLSAGCEELLGENFKGYSVECPANDSSCSGGSGGVSSSAESGGRGSVGGVGAVIPAYGSGSATSHITGTNSIDPLLNSAAEAGARAGDSGSAGGAEWSSAGTAGTAEAAGAGEIGTAGTAGSRGEGGTRSTTSAGPAATGGVAGFNNTGGVAGFNNTGGVAGFNNTGGVAGFSNTGGVAGSTGAAGSAEDPGSGGMAAAGGATNSAACQPDAPVVAECASVDGSYFPYVAVSAAQGVMMLSAEQFGGGFQAFASKRDSSLIAQLWNEAAGEQDWTPWLCFDSLPQPDRLAGHSLLDGKLEVFATTVCGSLYRRAEVSGWDDWKKFSLPLSEQAATDVAISETADDVNIIYVAQGGHVFALPRLGSEPSSRYGDWQEVAGTSSASLVTGGLRSDQRQQVFMLDTNGAVFTAIQSTTELDSPFGAWSDFDTSQLPLPLVDIEAPLGGPLPLEVYAVDANGTLWQRTQNKADGSFGSWTVWDGPSPPGALISLSGAGLKLAPNTPLRLTVLTKTRHIYTVRRTGTVWGDWRLFP